MSLLTETLERILSWLQQNQPEVISSLQPGLTDIQIQEITQDFPFELSHEIRELYQWRNGLRSEDVEIPSSSWAFMHHCFLSLQDALTEYNYRLELNTDIPEGCMVWDSQWLPIFRLDGRENLFAICKGSPEEPSILFKYFDLLDEYPAFYDSITSMMLTVLEYYETEIYPDADEIGMELFWQGIAYEQSMELYEHQEQLKRSIYIKHNPNSDSARASSETPYL